MDGWLKDLAPSTGLRTWFSHDPARWDEFKSRYAAELAAPEIAPLLRDLLREALEGPVTLLYAARDQEHNHALFLREYLGGMAADRPSGPPHPEAPAS